MPRVGFEPMIPVFERAKTVHALDRTATVIGLYNSFNEFKRYTGETSIKTKAEGHSDVSCTFIYGSIHMTSFVSKAECEY
jgi:hypothetical protein